jgi:hypothetical protein
MVREIEVSMTQGLEGVGPGPAGNFIGLESRSF